MPRVSMLVPSTEEGAVGQSARLVGENPAERTALAECLQCRQSLNRIEELLTERLERLLTLARCQAGTLMDDSRCHESEQRGAEHHSGDGEIPERHEGEDCHRRAGGDRDLGNVLAEEGLQLLDAVDDRQHHAAGAFGTEPYRAERDDLVVQAYPQCLLHPGCGPVRDHGSKIVEPGAKQDGGEYAEQRYDQFGGRCRAEQPGKELAKEDEARDADGEGEQAEQDPEDDAPPQSLRHSPQSQIEMHVGLLECGRILSVPGGVAQTRDFQPLLSYIVQR